MAVAVSPVRSACVLLQANLMMALSGFAQPFQTTTIAGSKGSMVLNTGQSSVTVFDAKGKVVPVFWDLSCDVLLAGRNVSPRRCNK